MELKLNKSMSCRIAAKGRWGNWAAASMGLSFFLRMVYYFGLKNLNDIPGFEIAFSVVLPLAVSVAFILALKLPRLTIPVALGGLSVAFAVNYFFAARMHLAGILCGLLLLGLSGLMLAAILGYVPERKWLLWAAMGTLGFRVLFVDVFGYILPLGDWQIAAYIPELSNLFGLAAVALLAAALRLRKDTEQ